MARTIESLVALGPDALPELIAELDATDNDMMLRCLGFTLRAIGDARATPALIRTIPKTLRPPGSDMGLRAEDEKLAAFMKKHDLDDRDEPLRYGFGRPVREIFGAIQKLTGHSFEEEQLFHVFAGGGAHQQRMKQRLFARSAKEWAAWWESHWSEKITEAAYSRVDLPDLETDATMATSVEGRRFKTGGGSSNWILESFSKPKAQRVFFDLDTGRAAGLPQQWRDSKSIETHEDEIAAWATGEGFDLMGVEYTAPGEERSCFALRPLGMQAWELGEEYWKWKSQDVGWDELKRKGTSAEKLLLHFDEEKKAFDEQATASFLVLTRDGARRSCSSELRFKMTTSTRAARSTVTTS